MQNPKRPLIATFILCLTASVAMFASTSTGKTFVESLSSTPAESQIVPAVTAPPNVTPLAGQNVNSFHFIEPLAARSGDPSKFDPALLNYLAVEVCEVAGSGCAVVKSFNS